MDKWDSHCPYWLFRETAAKETGLMKSSRMTWWTLLQEIQIRLLELGGIAGWGQDTEWVLSHTVSRGHEKNKRSRTRDQGPKNKGANTPSPRERKKGRCGGLMGARIIVFGFCDVGQGDVCISRFGQTERFKVICITRACRYQGRRRGWGRMFANRGEAEMGTKTK